MANQQRQRTEGIIMHWNKKAGAYTDNPRQNERRY